MSEPPLADAREQWRALSSHCREIRSVHMRELFSGSAERFERLSAATADLHVDYSKHRVTEETIGLLIDLARAAEVPASIAAMFAGQHVNVTEDRPALHTALRRDGADPLLVDGHDVMSEVNEVRGRMRAFARALREGRRAGATGRPLRDVVSIGIGGSYLGPLLASRALAGNGEPAGEAVRVHFVANLDGQDIAPLLARLDPEQTLFLVASKSFTTLETSTNAQSARRWLARALGEDRELQPHLAAVTANRPAAEAFGVDPEAVFDFWDWVGGRYSVWSAVGLPVAIAHGYEVYEDMLAGAERMDRHFREAPLEANLPVILGLLGIWYGDFLDARTQAIVAYDERLRLLPEYLQQLDMESNGKRVDVHGRALSCATAPVIWGGLGTNGQHAFFQALHQGTHLVPVDFLLPLRSPTALTEHHELLVANCLAQSRALMWGRSEDEARAELEQAGTAPERIRMLLPHKVFPGNVPSTTISYDDLTPATLGALLALYEHKVFVQGAIWGINSFDQWGVELGKQLAGGIARDLAAGAPGPGYDGSTAALITRYLARRG